MKNMKIDANGTEIRVMGDVVNEDAYISLTDIVKYKNPDDNAVMEKSCAAPGHQREGDGGSPSAGGMAAASERPGTTGTCVRVKDDLRRRVSGNQGGTVKADCLRPCVWGGGIFF